VRGLGETVEKQIVDEPPSAEKRHVATQTSPASAGTLAL